LDEEESLTWITLERMKVNAKSIPRTQLISLWKTLTNQPFPRVRAFQLADDDFERILHCRKCREDERREMKEWGKILSTRGTDGCVFNADEFAHIDFVILIRENAYHSTKEVLEHELSHIARGDL
jgi:hypothetical protein